MPIYAYKCPQGHVETRRRLYARRDTSVVCSTCSSQMRREEIGTFAIGRGGAPQAQPDATAKSQPRSTVYVAQNTVANAAVGMMFHNVEVEGDGNTFIDTKKDIVAKDSVVRLRNTRSKRSK